MELFSKAQPDISYPDNSPSFFSCNDGELNRIHEAARRTLRLCTADIFMDCPERERGGWLCDSLFLSKGAWQMFSDLSVEKDFLENYLLTDGSKTWNGFFPEVYPASKGTQGNVGITTWSLWLMEELWDYVRRSGDREMIWKHRTRVEAFVEGLLSLRGASGLIENLPTQFVDWSLSNQEACLCPISIPNNCLAVDALEKLSKLYQNTAWAAAANHMRRRIEALPALPQGIESAGDSAMLENGVLKRGALRTEGGLAMEMWSGFHTNDETTVSTFVEAMGCSPKERSDPNIGKPNLFIGLILRFETLIKLGEINVLLRELKDIYLPELRDGSGTLFEGYHATSGCHGMNGAVGAWLTNQVLGLGEPQEGVKKVTLSPHPCDLRWARGAACCSDGMILMNWQADARKRRIEIQLTLPEGWTYDLMLSDEMKTWTVLVNGMNAA